MQETTRRPLYLDAGSSLRVRLDGPALLACKEGESRRWYPLRLLSRVVSRPQVAWDGGAILALMEAGIPLFFLDKDGRLFGSCLGHIDTPLGLQGHLDALMAMPGWHDLYENWLRSEERRILHHLHSALRWPEGDLRPERARARLAVALQDVLGEDWHARLHPLLGALRTDVIHGLMQAGLDADVIAGLRGGTPLAKDVAALLGWTLRGRVLADPPGGGDGKGMVWYYERMLRPRLMGSLRRVVSSLWKLRTH